MNYYSSRPLGLEIDILTGTGKVHVSTHDTPPHEICTHNPRILFPLSLESKVENRAPTGHSHIIHSPLPYVTPPKKSYKLAFAPGAPGSPPA